MSPETKSRFQCQALDCPEKEICTRAFINRNTLAKEIGISDTYIRGYEERGMLTPQHCDRKPNLALYTSDQIKKLLRIRFLREEGLSVLQTKLNLSTTSFESLPQEYQDKFNSLKLGKTPDIISK
jgi:DNA-binding transcriptional MerR regulator